MGLHRFDSKKEQRKLWFKQNKNKITKISTITLSVIVFVVGVILLTKADFTDLINLDMISTKVGNFHTCSIEEGHVWYFDYTGDAQEFSVPCDGTYKLEVWGAQGGSLAGIGGLGGYSYGNSELTNEDILYVYVGEQPSGYTGGYNGGGDGLDQTAAQAWFSAGGGASDIRKNNNTLDDRIIVAGGGGGGIKYGNTAQGGSGGGTTGGNTNYLNCNEGDFQSGTNPVHTSNNTGAGQTYSGQANQDTGWYYSISVVQGSKGVGSYVAGGGYYGGAYYTTANRAYSGAGGSGYIGRVTNGSTESGIRSGNGYAKITLVSASNPTVQNAPKVELYDGMVPVTYDSNGNTVVADTSTDWYNYADHRWANAVLVSNTSSYLDSNNNVIVSKKGTIIPESDILQYYVYIPRYKYKLFNANGVASDEQVIEVEFQSANQAKANGNQNGQWLTHPAFTFGDTELNGFWVAKYEPSITEGELECTSDSCDVSNLRILPSKEVLTYMNLGNEFYSSRSIEKYFGLNTNQVDTHVMKNMDWGAVTYLSSSIYGIYSSPNTCANSRNNYTVTLSNSNEVNRCIVGMNPYHYGNLMTGCSGTIVDAYNLHTCTLWNDTTYGGLSSTTGNLYGIYDMAGGAWEDVMGYVFSDTTYSWNSMDSELSQPDAKYYDTYINPEDSDGAYSNGRLGDATKEVMKTIGNDSSDSSAWFYEQAYFPYGSFSPFFVRSLPSDSPSGLFEFSCHGGGEDNEATFRPVITKD